jgi:hypothetical protein
MYDYYLGGKDHFAADREAADKVLAAFPSVRTATRENRAFLGRAVRYLAAEAGIRQFLDIGHRHTDGRQHTPGLPGHHARVPSPGSSTSATTIANRVVHMYAWTTQVA